MQNHIVDVGNDLFTVKTNHNTKAYLDDNSNLCHKPAEEFGDDENILYARFDGEALTFFVIRNGVVEYVKAIGNSGRAMLDENPCRQKFARNVVRDTIAVNQNGQFWSAHAKNNLFWLVPRNSSWENFSLEPAQSVEIGKTNVILLVFDAALLDSTLERLNAERTNVDAILIAGKSAEEILALQTERKLPINSLDKLNRFALDGRDFLWLMVGADETVKRRMSERLQSLGIPRGAIVDFDIKAKITPTWLANVRAAAESDCDFIATGDLRAALDIDVNQIVKRKGINLACDGQDLRQSYFAAKYALEHNKSINFVLIGLTPEALDDVDDHFSERGADCRYAFANDAGTFDDKIFYSCFDSTVKFPEDATPDPNLTALKQSYDRTYRVDDVVPDETPLRAPSDATLQRLEEYIRLCSEHGAKPIGVLLPATVNNRTLERIKIMRRVLRLLEKATDFMFVDLSTLPTVEDFLADEKRLNIKGAAAVSDMLNWKLHDRGLLPFADMRLVTYERLRSLRSLFVKHEYDDMMDRIFAESIATLKHKEKIKIGFVLYDTSMWCGDSLYNKFARDERYEPTVFLCLRRDQIKQPMVIKDFEHGIEQLKSRDINVIGITKNATKVEQQDIIMFLTPYFGVLTRQFRPSGITAETLMTYLPYGLGVSVFAKKNFGIYGIIRQLFLATKEQRDAVLMNERLKRDRVFYSGHPKMDDLFSDQANDFDWKMARPDAVKIIWSPHWTINDTVKYATFQYNYEFMYEYAAAHPETSWVVKPHPNLLFSAVKEKIFPSTEAFEEYLRKWNELPNAQVVTGGYYQSIFATSDGLINDSGSFIAEYQYTRKPMLFLTRSTTKLNRMGTAIIEAGYHVDGKDFDGIKHFIEDVLINKNDTRYEQRTRVFDEELNYRKDNGMLASDMIFKTIDQQLGG